MGGSRQVAGKCARNVRARSSCGDGLSMLSTFLTSLFRPRTRPVPTAPAVADVRPEAAEAGDGLRSVLIDELAEIAGDFRPVLIGDMDNREQAERRLETLPLVFAWRVPGKTPATRVTFDINPLPVRHLVTQVRVPETEAFKTLEGRLMAEIRFRATEALAAAPHR